MDYTGHERAGYEAALGVSLEGWIGGSGESGGAAEPEPQPAQETYQPPPEPFEPATAEPEPVVDPEGGAY